MTTEPPPPADDPADEPTGSGSTGEPTGSGSTGEPAGSGSTAPRQSIGRAGAIMASGSMVSRALGLVRAALLTGVIGTTGFAADGFTIANTLPNQFYLLIAGGTLNAILVPQIVRAKLRPDGDDFVNRIITLSLAVLAVATVALTLAAPLLVRVYAKFDDPAALRLTTIFAVICLPQIFFYGLFTILGQVLNANGRFAGYMWAPALANIVAVIGLVWFQRAGHPSGAAPADWTPEMIAILAGSATLSIAIQALALIIPLRRIGFRYRPVWGLRGHGLGEVSHVAKWTFGSIVVSQLGYVVTSRVLTGTTSRGAAVGESVSGLTAYTQAFLIVMLPHGLVTVSLVTALYTSLSEAASRGDTRQVRRYHDQGMRLPAVIIVPGIAFMAVLAPHIASTFFFNNTLEETRAIAVVLSVISWMVIPMSWTYLNDRVFYAHGMTWMSFRLQCVTTGIATVGAVVALQLDPATTAMALGAGQVLAFFVAAAVGFWVLRRQLGPLGLRTTARVYLSLIVPAIVTAVALFIAIDRLFPDLGETRGVAGLMAGGLVLGGAGVVMLAVTWSVASLLGVREISTALQPVTRRLRRR